MAQSRSRWGALLLLPCTALFAVPAHGQVTPAEASAAASPFSAASPLDLTQFPLLEQATVETPSRARLNYEAPATVTDAYQFQLASLTKLGWQELPGGYLSDTSCSSAFEQDGYKVSVTVYPAATPGHASVSLTQHGSVKLDELPLPTDMTLFFAGPASVSYLTGVAAAATKAACRERLVASGWEPYGEAGDALMFRRGPTRLTAFIAAAPAQDGKTMAQFSSELLSAELPLVPHAKNAHYSDAPTQLSFDSGATMDQVVDYYRTILANSGWQPTTERRIPVSIYEVMIFRHPSGDLLELQLHDVAGQARSLLRYQTAAQVAELDARARQAMAERQKSTQPPETGEKLVVPLPAEAKEIEFEDDSLQFQVPAGKARAAIEWYRQELGKAGWKEESASLQDVAGVVVFSQPGRNVVITYTDVGFMAAEISVDVTGIQLARPVNR